MKATSGVGGASGAPDGDSVVAGEVGDDGQLVDLLRGCCQPGQCAQLKTKLRWKGRKPCGSRSGLSSSAKIQWRQEPHRSALRPGVAGAPEYE